MEKILDKELSISKIDEKTHKKIFFNIEKEMSEIKIEFKYSPNIAIDKNNIMEAFSCDRCEMTSEEALFFKEEYLNGNKKLKNLATLSLYQEDEYMGCAHRGLDKQEIFISAENSTPGFKTSKVKKGQWEIIISIHGLNTDSMNISLRAYVG